MKREKLLKSNDYWIVQIQNNLFSILHEYMEKYDLNRKDLAEKFGVTKGYISQILKGDFDHKISKLVDLSLAAEKAPILNFVDIDKFIKDDACNKIYELMPMLRGSLMTYSQESIALTQKVEGKEEKESFVVTNYVTHNEYSLETNVNPR